MNDGPRLMRIMVLGIRGIPGVQGGVETHAEELYGRIAKLGFDVEVIVRTHAVPEHVTHFGAVRIRRLWAPKRAGWEALVHSMIGVLYAAVARPDILHVHAIGPAIVTPIARLFGLKVIVTHHGQDYARDKWGPLGRWILRAGERMGMRYSNARIVISKGIMNRVESMYGKRSDLIHNGVAPVQIEHTSDYIESIGLTPGQYFLQVSRIVPEKRQLDLIEAFAAMQPKNWQLVLVGAETRDAYCKQVQSAARATGAVFTGLLKGAPLSQIYSHAGAFVLPSSHEGMAIVLLEASSYGLPCLASDIPANLEINLEPASYFPLGDIAALARKLHEMTQAADDGAKREARRTAMVENYSWDTIAQQTIDVYRRVIGITESN